MSGSSETRKLFEIYGQLADLKEVDYKNTLVITAIIELLVEKGIINRSDIIEKAQELDLEQDNLILRQRLDVQ
ncbi:hypothetical protein [Desulfuribacillus alkaliarsenatis]|uniref:Uncharacterized protein n=1 Tax=Desulfuribacillus alkaliarsenatis TaxID=766136 RepID=A0A1E5G2P7_9FIRM|nr:hypothetical protein [Desulfuribacillus alkaliarsenatis]OEF97347.1 hypothetical protein BHF68_03815 [Desulfuribacillus alkaliarsenatis]